MEKYEDVVVEVVPIEGDVITTSCTGVYTVPCDSYGTDQGDV